MKFSLKLIEDEAVELKVELIKADEFDSIWNDEFSIFEFFTIIVDEDVEDRLLSIVEIVDLDDVVATTWSFEEKDDLDDADMIKSLRELERNKNG